MPGRRDDGVSEDEESSKKKTDDGKGNHNDGGRFFAAVANARLALAGDNFLEVAQGRPASLCLLGPSAMHMRLQPVSARRLKRPAGARWKLWNASICYPTPHS